MPFWGEITRVDDLLPNLVIVALLHFASQRLQSSREAQEKREILAIATVLVLELTRVRYCMLL